MSIDREKENLLTPLKSKIPRPSIGYDQKSSGVLSEANYVSNSKLKVPTTFRKSQVLLNKRAPCSNILQSDKKGSLKITNLEVEESIFEIDTNSLTEILQSQPPSSSSIPTSLPKATCASYLSSTQSSKQRLSSLSTPQKLPSSQILRPPTNIPKSTSNRSEVVPTNKPTTTQPIKPLPQTSLPSIPSIKVLSAPIPPISIINSIPHTPQKRIQEPTKSTEKGKIYEVILRTPSKTTETSKKLQTPSRTPAKKPTVAIGFNLSSAKKRVPSHIIGKEEISEPFTEPTILSSLLSSSEQNNEMHDMSISEEIYPHTPSGKILSSRHLSMSTKTPMQTIGKRTLEQTNQTPIDYVKRRKSMIELPKPAIFNTEESNAIFLEKLSKALADGSSGGLGEDRRESFGPVIHSPMKSIPSHHHTNKIS